MTKGNPAWEQFERRVQELLDLRSTPGSGNQWHDIGDGVSKPDDAYKLIVDCKYTDRKSFSVSGDTLQPWLDKAGLLGYHFALPVRLEGMKGTAKNWVTVPLDDYVELVDAARFVGGPERCGAWIHRHPLVCCRRKGHSDRHDNGVMEWTA